MKTKLVIGASIFLIPVVLFAFTSLFLSRKQAELDCFSYNNSTGNTVDNSSDDTNSIDFTQFPRITVGNMSQIQEIASLDVNAPVRLVAISPDNSLVLTNLPSGQVLVWNIISSEKYVIPTNDHLIILDNIAFSPNGRLIAFYGHRGRIVLWNVVERDFVAAPINTNYVSTSYYISFLDDSLLAYNLSRGVIICDLTTGKTEQILETDPNDISAMDIDYENSFIVYGTSVDSSDTMPAQRLWSMLDQQLVYDIPFHQSPTFTVDISGNGAFWASVNGDGWVGIWSTETGLLVNEFYDTRIDNIALGYNGDILFYSQDDESSIKVASILELDSENSLDGHNEQISHLKLNATGNILISSSLDGTIKLWGVSPSHN